jgi:23S rRNA (guanine745-N1)-methyltransferase
MMPSSLRSQAYLLECPICRGPMNAQGEGSIFCANRHCFDVSKKGYVNLLNSPVKTHYDKPMMNARRIIGERGFFRPLAESVGETLLARGIGPGMRILDAGCGEGSFLAQVKDYLTGRGVKDLTWAGFDISKSGIQAAASRYPGNLWCVADLTRIPFKERQFDVALNMLSPSNYREFKRCLKDGGLLIKIIPAPGYLKELRTFLYKGSDRKQTYSNAETIGRFRDRFGVPEVVDIQYTFLLERGWAEDFIRMTPLSWHVPQERQASARVLEGSELTAGFTVLVGEHREERGL